MNNEHSQYEPIVLLDDNIVEIDPKLLTDAEHPIPKLGEAHYLALKASIEANGQQLPIMITADGRVHDGRLRRRACADLNKKVKAQYITHAQAERCWLSTCVHREWTVPDRARMIAYLQRHPDLYQSVPLESSDSARADDRIACYLNLRLGWVREGQTGKQVQRYLRLHGCMEKADLATLGKLDACKNVNSALMLVGPKRARGMITESTTSDTRPETVVAMSPDLTEMISAFTKAARTLAEQMSNREIADILAQAIGNANEGAAA